MMRKGLTKCISFCPLCLCFVAFLSPFSKEMVCIHKTTITYKYGSSNISLPVLVLMLLQRSLIKNKIK